LGLALPAYFAPIAARLCDFEHEIDFEIGFVFYNFWLYNGEMENLEVECEAMNIGDCHGN
jgi:hypothetical protein